MTLPLAACRLPLAACRLPFCQTESLRQLSPRPAFHLMMAVLPDRAMARLRFVLLVSACCWAGSFACAAAEGTKPNGESIEAAFSSTVAKINIPSRDQAVSVTWTFSNLWCFPMVVERFEKSCGGLSGQTARSQDSPESVAPWEFGEICATFMPDNLRGFQRKSLHVRFVGHDEPVEE